MILTRYIILLVSWVFMSSLQAQYYEIFEAPVSSNSNELQFPFTGGFENPQFSSSDMNNDGLMDIYVFDRNGGVSSVFLRTDENNEYPFLFSKYYNQFFPKQLEGFSLLRDFNGDGIDDIFCSAIPEGAAGLIIYQASRNQDIYSYNKRRMGRPEGSAPIIWNNLPSGQVYTAVTDIPAIKDVDEDGDLDILSFDEAGSYVYFCKNYQVEKALPADTMDFDIADYCFGKFLESGLSQTIKLSTNPALCASNFSEGEHSDNKHLPHSGSTIMAFDPDNDGDLDLALGDLTYNGIVYLENGGSSSSAFMTSTDPNFPSYDNSVDMPVFLAGFDLDVNNDGLVDVLVAPNALGSVQNVNNIWYYRNTGNSTFPFTLQSQSFLADETIDLGSLSVPAIVDYNGDGLMDIVVSGAGEFDGTPGDMRLLLFVNNGTPRNPSFVLIDDDYLNFSQYSSNSSNPAVCFGDMDQDNDMDLIIGDEAGKLYYFQNTAGSGNVMEFAAPIYNWMDITSGQRIRPTIFDFNKDGLNDLIIGERNTNGYNDPLTGELLTGNINYYQNIGSPGDPLFDPVITSEPNSPVLGQVRVNFSSSTSARGGASPYFVTVDAKDYLIVGSSGGRISMYEITSTNPNEAAVLHDDRLGGLVEGLWSAPALYDFDADGFLDILIGNIRGGLSFFKTDIMGTSSNTNIVNSKDKLKIYPNPTKGLVYFQMPPAQNGDKILLHDIQGRLLLSREYSDKIELGFLNSGIYNLTVTDDKGNRYVERLIIY